MVVRKFNYYRFFIFIVVVVSVLCGVIFLVKDKKYKDTYEYKLVDVGYSKEESSILQKKLKTNEIDKILKLGYNEYILSFLDEKYFIFSNLDDYLAYKKEHKDTDYKKIVAIVNTEGHIDWFDNEKETDTNKNELMLVNRLYGLSKDYVPSDIVDVPTQYAYTGMKISNSILDSIISLIGSAKDIGYTFVVSDGYRSYEAQENLYNNYANSYGMQEADEFVARAGHSEYQTGLTFDLKPYNKVIEDVENNEEYIWLRENAHKFGFIFRLEKDKEDLTLFPSSYWKLRYVGVDAATLIHTEDICFEEYYAYFVGGK